MPIRACSPPRCPPDAASAVRAIALVARPPEWAMVPLWWSTSHKIAAPADSTAPAMTASAGSGLRPNAYGAVEVTATQAAAPETPWLYPIMLMQMCGMKGIQPVAVALTVALGPTGSQIGRASCREREGKGGRGGRR